MQYSTCWPSPQRLRLSLHSKTSIASTDTHRPLPTSSQVAAISPTTCIGPVVCLLWSMRLLRTGHMTDHLTLTGEHLSAAVAGQRYAPNQSPVSDFSATQAAGWLGDPLWQSVSRRRSRQAQWAQPTIPRPRTGLSIGRSVFRICQDGQVQAGDVIVIRNEGPVGGPGMRNAGCHRCGSRCRARR